MKPEQSERFYIEELFSQSTQKGLVKCNQLKEIDKLTGDASTRRYYRLFCQNDSYVVCLDNPTVDDIATSPFVDMQKFLEGKNIRVPKIYDMNLKRGYLLEEDLGDMTLLQKLGQLENIQAEHEIYHKVIVELVKLHKISAKDMAANNVVKLSFDYEKYKQEIDFTFKFYLKLFLKVTSEEKLEELSKLFDPVLERLANEKRVLTHRDFHSRNLMVKNNELVVIDFQDARMGIPQYDLVSLLEDCYYKVHGENKKKLIDFYWKEMSGVDHGQKDFNKFMGFYHDMTIQRVFKAIGSFAYIYNTRKDERYLKYIGFGMEKLRVTMLKSDMYKDLRKCLFKIYYEN
ncbi:MAG: phosphotransferase [Bacteriovoracaceae bacterium]|nr:phosphotransferase [Bacteriovoracaceae bacterium]